MGLTSGARWLHTVAMILLWTVRRLWRVRGCTVGAMCKRGDLVLHTRAAHLVVWDAFTPLTQCLRAGLVPCCHCSFMLVAAALHLRPLPHWVP